MSKEIGTLVVVVLKARNLRDKHTIHKQDVYAQATLSKVTKKTKTDVRGGQHPVWDEELRFPIYKPVSDETRKLEIACYSKEPRSDELVGRGEVDISETLKTGEFDDWVPLQMEDGQHRGDVFLEMTFYSAAPPPQRRPSKWEPKDRLKRPESSYAYPASPPQATPTPHGHPGHSPAHKHDVLPPLPEEAAPPPSIPSILRPGGGAPVRTSPKAGGGLLPPEHSVRTHAPRDPSPPAPVRHSPPNPPLESIPPYLRPGGGASRPPAQAQPAPPAPGPAPYIPEPQIPAPEIPAYNAALEIPAYNPAPEIPVYNAALEIPAYNPPPRPQTYYGAGDYITPQARPYPEYTAPAPRPHSYEGYSSPPVSSWYGYPDANADANGYRREQNFDLPDPYLQARYQTPLPLPKDERTSATPSYSYSQPPQAQPKPPKHPQAAPVQPKPAASAPKPKEPSREERDRQIALKLKQEEEERQRKLREQEERDMELARQLDLELNLDGGGGGASESRTAAGAPGMPGGL
ncbi:hypothetical protein L226DRAFT_58598 [Lentinus tigrinus ALCF2SS1-7]|uniref:C2 domain-containing protein n=1 Tax=Lentinus tigrinus ALCF2SS1-6 TaxID=1328759 RepID=A0A5C2SBF7_9APHY|nr:hypothetical protein L227DRAFT_78245 [Lentinus tigrinus ALCF2SS1-6]RPD75243.1 hypothetical protein L226DRAFT_58598 [Lentinus tigrinus ALCF2SS1-7]